jgi:hypothetical protein
MKLRNFESNLLYVLNKQNICNLGKQEVDFITKK